MAFDPAALPPGLANRVLEREAWARERLAAHAGKSFVIAVGPARAPFAIAADGTFAPPAPGTATDLTLALSPLALAPFLHEPARFDEFVSASGDSALAATLKDLAQTLPWFVERAFAQVLGEVAGQRVADAGRTLLALPGYAATRLKHNVGSYVRDESGAVADRADVQAFGENVAALAARVDALTARVDALAKRPGS
jgi:ubiquinone biosynthesis accessory factor UbiJ